jgi:oligosaccharide reducing-end xylanase
MKLRFLIVIALLPVAVHNIVAQIDPDYEVATWHKFKSAAVTYTFDGYNNSPSKQLSVAVPLFDQYNFKVTITTITNWISDWTPLINASNNGHEIASLTLTHNYLNVQTVESQENEISQSQNIINNHITNARCEILAYPYCVIGDLPTIKKYYIAGRICSGQIEPSTPSDFYALSSILTGTSGSVKTAADFYSRVTSAKASKGWCVFLIHGIDSDDGGYSPIPSAEISSHLSYMNTNIADYWVATFRDVVKYIRERNAVSLVESAITADSLQLLVTDTLTNATYDVPLTIRRFLPSGWQNANVYVGARKINSSVSAVGTNSYIVFDAVPDQGNVYLSKSNAAVAVKDIKGSTFIQIEPNPFIDSIKINTGGLFDYQIYTRDGRLAEKGTKVDSAKPVGSHLTAGAYILNIITGSKKYSTKIIKH